MTPLPPPCRSLASFVAHAVWTYLEAGAEREICRQRMARAMSDLLRCPGVLTGEQLVPFEGERYRTVPLWSDAALDLSMIALVWKSGQKSAIHDHHAACLVGVYQGAERETRYERTAPDADTVFAVGQRTLSAGSVCIVTPDEGEIHRVEAIAAAPVVTVSLHFYEVDVTRRPNGSSILRCFQEAPCPERARAARSLAAVS